MGRPAPRTRHDARRRGAGVVGGGRGDVRRGRGRAAARSLRGGGRGGPRPLSPACPSASPSRSSLPRSALVARAPRGRPPALAGEGPARARVGAAGRASRAHGRRLLVGPGARRPGPPRASRLAGEGSARLRSRRARGARRPPARPARARPAPVGPAAAGSPPADRLRPRGRGPPRVARRDRGLGRRRLLGAALGGPRLAAPAPVRPRGLRGPEGRREPARRGVGRHPGSRRRFLRRPVGPPSPRLRGASWMRRPGMSSAARSRSRLASGRRISPSPPSRAVASSRAGAWWRPRAPPARTCRSERRRPLRRASSGRSPR